MGAQEGTMLEGGRGHIGSKGRVDSRTYVRPPPPLLPCSSPPTRAPWLSTQHHECGCRPSSQDAPYQMGRREFRHEEWPEDAQSLGYSVPYGPAPHPSGPPGGQWPAGAASLAGTPRVTKAGHQIRSS